MPSHVDKRQKTIKGRSPHFVVLRNRGGERKPATVPCTLAGKNCTSRCSI